MSDNDKVKLAVFTAGLFQMGNLGLSPSLSRIAAEFPDAGDAAVQVLMTCPDIMVICATLLAGRLASRIQRKWIAALGLGLYTLAGVCGALFSVSFPILFVWALMLGTGMGLFIPTLSAAISLFFRGEERSRVLGLQSVAVNAGGILLTVFGGFLAAVSWRRNYLVYVPAAAAMLCAACFLPGNRPEPRKRAGRADRVPVPAGQLLSYCALGFFFMIIYNVCPSNTAMLFRERGAARPEVLSGLANGLTMAGGMISAMLFSRVSRRLQEGMFTLAFLLEAAGLGLCLIRSVPAVFLGAFLAGAGVSYSMPTGMLLVGKKIPEPAIARSSSLFIACFYLGGFCSALVITPLAGAAGPGAGLRLALGCGSSLVFALLSVPLTRRLGRIPVLRD